MENILILGGAGFIGSQLTEKFSHIGTVTVIDGLVPGTGGSFDNIRHIEGVIFIEKTIENVSELAKIVSGQNIVIDAMGWTSHLGAISDPLLDLKLNLHSHLVLLDCLKDHLCDDSLIIYLGSAGQYGNCELNLVDETVAMLPIDIQGINKVSAENYFRVYSRLYGLNVVSFRVPNCYGQSQPHSGADIGLVGGFIRSALLDKNIEVFGHDRRRNVVYVKDLVDFIYSISTLPNESFESYNVPCNNISIKVLAETISSLVSVCTVSFKSVPEKVRKIDVNSFELDVRKIECKIGTQKMSNLKAGLGSTIEYFLGRLR